MPVRATTRRQIVAAAPVVEIVAALETRFSPVRNFVTLHSRRAQNCFRLVHQIGLSVVVWRGQFSARRQMPEVRARLNR